MRYMVEFYAGSYFGGWNLSYDAPPEGYATRQQAEDRVAELKKKYPTRGYKISETV